MTRRLLRLSVPLLTLCTVLPVGSARADPILITAGSVDVAGEGPSSILAIGDLHGTQGFRAEVTMLPGHGSWACLPPCGAPGTLISPDAFMDTVDGGGTIQRGGISYPAGSGSVPNSAVLLLLPFGDSILLPPLSASAVFSTSFALRPTSFVTATDADFHQTVRQVVGRGTFRVVLTPNQLDGVWQFTSASYHFQPVPEPVPSARSHFR